MQDYAYLLDAARRWTQNGHLQTATTGGDSRNPANKSWKEGRSSTGGTPANDAPEHMNPTPKAPGLSSRTKPGTVPPRKRGYRPEEKLNR